MSASAISHSVSRPVGGYRFTDGCEEGLLAEAGEETKALQLVLDWIFHLSKTQIDTGGVQGFVEFAECIGGRDINAGDRLCRDHKSSDRRGGVRNSIQDTLLE